MPWYSCLVIVVCVFGFLATFVSWCCCVVCGWYDEGLRYEQQA